MTITSPGPLSLTLKRETLDKNIEVWLLRPRPPSRFSEELVAITNELNNARSQGLNEAGAVGARGSCEAVLNPKMRMKARAADVDGC